MLRHGGFVLVLAAMLAGRGGSREPEATTAPAGDGAPAEASVQPEDVRIVIDRIKSESVSVPAVEAAHRIQSAVRFPGQSGINAASSIPVR